MDISGIIFCLPCAGRRARPDHPGRWPRAAEAADRWSAADRAAQRAAEAGARRSAADKAAGRVAGTVGGVVLQAVPKASLPAYSAQ